MIGLTPGSTGDVERCNVGVVGCSRKGIGAPIRSVALRQQYDSGKLQITCSTSLGSGAAWDAVNRPPKLLTTNPEKKLRGRDKPARSWLRSRMRSIRMNVARPSPPAKGGIQPATAPIQGKVCRYIESVIALPLTTNEYPCSSLPAISPWPSCSPLALQRKTPRSY